MKQHGDCSKTRLYTGVSFRPNPSGWLLAATVLFLFHPSRVQCLLISQMPLTTPNGQLLSWMFRSSTRPGLFCSVSPFSFPFTGCRSRCRGWGHHRVSKHGGTGDACTYSIFIVLLGLSKTRVSASMAGICAPLFYFIPDSDCRVSLAQLFLPSSLYGSLPSSCKER